jgi:hypothetical protein
VASFTLRPSLVIANSRARRSSGSATRSIKPFCWSSSRMAMMRVLSAPIASARAAWVRIADRSSASSTL